jgi:hypothetical protein
MESHHIAVQPPAAPWCPLVRANPSQGCLVFYISDDLSALPVRAVTKLLDNKSDPNLETGSYGLFSTCARQMRASVIRNGLSYLFFVTRRDHARVLTGYYRLAWHCNNLSVGSNNDFALAADAMWFIDPPLPLNELPDPVRHTATKRFRLFTCVDATQTSLIRQLLESHPNRSADYLAEIDRLERLNAYHTGFRCWNYRSEPFSWTAAVEYLIPRSEVRSQPARKTPTSSPSSLWICNVCTAFVSNKARLRRCPLCGEIGSLRPCEREEAQDLERDGINSEERRGTV